MKLFLCVTILRTCRRRKVKCDERGRNSDTVAYGGPLGTASGCKRCEDSGRPCHGYGAQAPNRPLLSPYPVPFNPGEAANRSTPLYTFSNYNQENAATLACIPNYLTTSGPSSMLPELTQWNRSSKSLKGGEHHSGPQLQSSRLSSTSSTSSAAPVLASATTALHPAPAPLITLPLDLRRYSVPSYPTWHSANLEHHSSNQYYNTETFRNSFYGNGDIFQPDGSIQDSNPADPLNNIVNPNHSPISDSSAPNGPLQRSYDPDTRPNTHNPHRTHFASVDFVRPHTSSGISLLHANQPQHAQSRNYPSPIFPHEFIGGIPDIPYNPSVSPTTTSCSEFGRAGWSESIGGNMHSTMSGQSLYTGAPPFPDYHSPVNSKELSPTIQRESVVQSPAFLKSVHSPEASRLSSLEVRNESYSPSIDLHPGTHTNAPRDPSLHTISSKCSFRPPHSLTMDSRASLTNSRDDGASKTQRSLSSAEDFKGRPPAPLHSESYVDSYELDMNRTMVDRKNSSSSSSSLSALENSPSPRVSLPRGILMNQNCPPSSSSSSSSPASITQINHKLLSPTEHSIAHHSPSVDLFEAWKQTSHTSWNAVDAPPPRDLQGHEFPIKINDDASTNVETEIIENNHLTSTSNSTFPCIRPTQCEYT